MWLTIDKLHEHVKGGQMFVVKAFDVSPYDGYVGAPYTTDPYCAWVNDMDEFMQPHEFMRWPHPFMPTHFCLLPEERE